MYKYGFTDKKARCACKQGAGDEMGHRPRRRERLLPPSGEAVLDAESRLDGHGQHMDEMVLCHQAEELPVRVHPSFYFLQVRPRVSVLEATTMCADGIPLTDCYKDWQP